MADGVLMEARWEWEAEDRWEMDRVFEWKILGRET